MSPMLAPAAELLRSCRERIGLAHPSHGIDEFLDLRQISGRS